MTEPPAGALAQISYLRDQLDLRASQIDWERLLTVNYREYLQRGCSVVDVGAHHGMHSRRMMRYLRPSHLVLVEPISELANGLRREFRNKKQVDVRQVALGVEAKKATFVVNDLSPGESGLLERRYQAARQQTRSIDVVVERLDDWDLPFVVDFMKIDVEGGEVDVLRGGRQFLSRNRPILSVEYGADSYSAYGWNSSTLYEFAVHNRYQAADLFGNLIRADEWDNLVDTYYWDFILLPQERMDSSAAVRAKIKEKAMHSVTHFRPAVERWRKRLRR